MLRPGCPEGAMEYNHGCRSRMPPAPVVAYFPLDIAIGGGRGRLHEMALLLFASMEA